MQIVATMFQQSSSRVNVTANVFRVATAAILRLDHFFESNTALIVVYYTLHGNAHIEVLRFAIDRDFTLGSGIAPPPTASV